MKRHLKSNNETCTSISEAKHGSINVVDDNISETPEKPCKGARFTSSPS